METKALRELLSQMSLKEKIGQLLQLTGNFFEEGGEITGPMQDMNLTEDDLWLTGSILGTVGAEKLRKIQETFMEKHPHHIPLLFMADVINGYRTIFPIPLAQGSSFDPAVSRTGASVAAAESAAVGLHVTFSPMVDLVRDARWGRVMESTGEDVYLNRQFARAQVEGYQGKDLSAPGKVAACVKHFAGYGAPLAGRDYNAVELSPRTFRDDYLPAYKEAVDAGAALVMTSFNTLDRVPSTGNKTLMRDILRDEMGFDGVLISDWGAVEELVRHRIAETRKEAARLSMEAGVDIEMMTPCYSSCLEELISEGTVAESLLDEAVLRILELKNKLGLFENPFKDGSAEAENTVVLSKEHLEAAQNAAEQTFVLLKNDDAFLPLCKKDKLALIGPHGDNPLIYGAWSIFASPKDTVTLRQGMEQAGASFRYAKGSPMLDNLRGLEMFKEQLPFEQDLEQKDALLQEALEAAKAADKVVLALGEFNQQSGEAASRGDITLPRCQLDLLREVSKVNENVAVVLFTGRPLDIREVLPYAKSILCVWQPGTMGGPAIARTLFGDNNPSGKLSMSFPWSVGQVPITYAQFPTGRSFDGESKEKYVSKYLDIPNKPLFPFGFGLSYTTFSVSPVTLSGDTLEKDGSLQASVTVKNTGDREGQEVVQLYVRDEYGSVTRPVREMKGFRKVTLQPGEEAEVTFTLTEKELRFTTINGEKATEPGAMTLWIGTSSETDNSAAFVIK